MAPPFEDDPNGTADIHSGAEMSDVGANDIGMVVKQPAASTTSNPARQALDSHSSTEGVAEDLTTSPETTTMVNNNNNNGSVNEDGSPRTSNLTNAMEAFDLTSGASSPQPGATSTSTSEPGSNCNPERTKSFRTTDENGGSIDTTPDKDRRDDDMSTPSDHIQQDDNNTANAVETSHSLALGIAAAFNNNKNSGGATTSTGGSSNGTTAATSAEGTTAAPTNNRSMLGARKYCCQEALMNDGRCSCNGSGGNIDPQTSTVGDVDAPAIVRAGDSAAVSATNLLCPAPTAGDESHAPFTSTAAPAADTSGTNDAAAGNNGGNGGVPSTCDDANWHVLGLCSCGLQQQPQPPMKRSEARAGKNDGETAATFDVSLLHSPAIAAGTTASSAAAPGATSNTGSADAGAGAGQTTRMPSLLGRIFRGGGGSLPNAGSSGSTNATPAPAAAAAPAPSASNSNAHVIPNPPPAPTQQHVTQQALQRSQMMQRAQQYRQRLAAGGAGSALGGGTSMGGIGQIIPRRARGWFGGLHRGIGVDTLYYQAPDTKPLPPGFGINDTIDAEDSVCRSISPQEIQSILLSGCGETCKICLEPIVDPKDICSNFSPPTSRVVCLRRCAHRFHLACIRDAMSHQTSLKCPECQTVLLSEQDIGDMVSGNSPSGTMDISPCSSVAGHNDCGGTVISYSIHTGVQKQYHPHPGQHHGGAYRQAYLPDDEEGRQLLSRLKYAFLHGLTFQVGKSLTNGADNQVTWASIHHKTSPCGGPHGFPDPSYLQNCNGELDTAGVPSAQVCAEYLASRRAPDFIQRAVQSDTLSLGENQVVLFHLIHAEYCSHNPAQNHGAQCSIVSCCAEFKELRQHVDACADPACTFNYCQKAKKVLSHYRLAQCSAGCAECGTVRNAIEAATTLGDDIGSLPAYNLDQVIRTASHARRKYDVPFFYQEPASDLFLSESSPYDTLVRQIGLNTLLTFIQQTGVEGSSVVLNPHLTKTWSKFKAFVEEGEKCARSKDDQFTVRVVFHGTAPENIDPILEHGLDQNRRRGQAYGQGEYFASNAAMSSTYCRGGNKMLVFAIICRDMDVRSQVKDQAIVVVRESNRQLPLGTLTFTNLTMEARMQADAFQVQLNKLKEEQQKLEKIAEEAKEKEKIVRFILRGQYDVASEYYEKARNRNGGDPPSTWAEEVACYVRDHIRDSEMVEIYFPHLPARPTLAKDVDMLNVDKCENEAREAKRKADEYLKQSKQKSIR